MKLNQKFGLDIPIENRLLTLEDLKAVMKFLVGLRNGVGVQLMILTIWATDA